MKIRFCIFQKTMSASVTLTKKFEIRNLEGSLKSKCKGKLKLNVKVPFKIEFVSKFQKYNNKGYVNIGL